jgi:outer membrane protein
MKHTLLALSLIFASTVYAQQSTVKVGFTSITPNSSASAISGPLTPVNALSIEVKKQNTLFFSYSREITDSWDLELAAGWPPTHEVAIKVIDPTLPASVRAYDGKTGAKVRQVAPTVFANYKFGDKNSSFRPFLGIGLNYTTFDKTESTTDGNNLNGGATNISLEDSFGLAAQAGLSYRIDDKWSISSSVATAQVKTKMTSNTLGVVRTADVKFRPTVVTVSMGYSF